MTGDSPFNPPGPPPGQPPWSQPVPQPAPEPGYFPPPTAPPTAPSAGPGPKKSNKAVWIVLGVVIGCIVLAVGACAALIIVVASDDDLREVVRELTIDFSEAVPATGAVSCKVTGVDFADDYVVFVTITNASGETSAYQVDYELVGPDGELLGFDFGIISGLEPGDTVRDNTAGIVDGSPDWSVVGCNVLSSRRVPTG